MHPLPGSSRLAPGSSVNSSSAESRQLDVERRHLSLGEFEHADRRPLLHHHGIDPVFAELALKLLDTSLEFLWKRP